MFAFSPDVMRKLGAYYILNQKDVEKLVDDGDTIFHIRNNLYAEMIKAHETYLIDHIIEMAKKNGVTDLYILNEDFIMEAIQKHTPTPPLQACGHTTDPSMNYCPICGQALKWD